jgi:hypothetical protein
MKVSLLESTAESAFGFDDERSGQRPVARFEDLPPEEAISQEVLLPRAHRPVAPTVIDEALSSFEAYTDPTGCSCSSVRTRPARLYVPPPPPPVRRRVVTAPPPSYPPPPPSAYPVYPSSSVFPSYPPPETPPSGWAVPPTPMAGFPPPALLSRLEVLDVPPRSPTSRRLLAPMLALAACLMGASLWLSAPGGLRSHHDARSAPAAAEGGLAAPLSCEMSASELAGIPGPAPTLGSAPPAFARGATVARHAEITPGASASAATSVAPPPPVAAAPPDAPPRLEQATRTAQMLREQLNSSVR